MLNQDWNSKDLILLNINLKEYMKISSHFRFPHESHIDWACTNTTPTVFSYLDN